MEVLEVKNSLANSFGAPKELGFWKKELSAAGNVKPSKSFEVQPRPGDFVSSLSFSPNVNHMLASWDNQVRCWEIMAGSVLSRAAMSHYQPVLCSSQKDDESTVLTVRCDNIAKMLPLVSGGQPMQDVAHYAPVKEVTWTEQLNCIVQPGPIDFYILSDLQGDGSIVFSRGYGKDCQNVTLDIWWPIYVDTGRLWQVVVRQRQRYLLTNWLVAGRFCQLAVRQMQPHPITNWFFAVHGRMMDPQCSLEDVIRLLKCDLISGG
ncbi:uncharacterized protein A4U43_C03F1430 [Asparagus officinalis]|uniref:Uncharacterized protein n=1 Tax=Asparagus officinalis TaxID=4686 RepID=A0A5P1F980_ASPOF|nr:uncharacterized protein A4U43_C03F1430 [Asparagus officinalis]